MATAARKARKRLLNGDASELDKELARALVRKAPKVGTPFTERAWYAAVIPERIGGKPTGRMALRSAKKRARALAARTVAE